MTLHVTDQTGATPPTLSMSSDTTSQFVGFGTATRISGNAQDGTYQWTATVNQTNATGPWTIQLFSLDDTLGNNGTSQNLANINVTGDANDPLAGLLIAAESDGGIVYDRGTWSHWRDDDGDCIDTRHEVLFVETITPVFMAGCVVVGGTWFSWFDAVTVTDPSSLDVDHMVPLKEAHDSGGWAWTAEQKRAFANDLDIADALNAVTASTNRSKGSRDPAEWKPPDQASWCRYATAWVTVKTSYGLTADPAEAAELSAMLATC